MHGIPGFGVDGMPAVEWLPLGETDALLIASTTYALTATSARRLETERDDTFAIDTADDSRFVLKIAHPADSARELDFQAAALEFARASDPRLPLQRIRPAGDGSLLPTLPEHAGRIARLFDWMPGELLLDSHPDDHQLSALGRALGRLTTALAGFEHPASERPFAWDLAQFAGLAPLADRFPTSDIREVVARYTSTVEPVLHSLPRQVIHNDFNTGNVLVDPSDPDFVTGILDFGDVIRTIRVADVAIAACYLVYPLGRDWRSVQPFVDGYESVVPLTMLERRVLRDLVMCRFAQRILIYRWMSRTVGPNPDQYHAGVENALHQLLEED